MLEVKPFAMSDIDRVDPKPEHVRYVEIMRQARKEIWPQIRGRSYTAMSEDGSLAFAGVVPQWEGRGIGWCVIDKNVSMRFMVEFSRKVVEYLDAIQPLVYRRIEMSVPNGFDKAVAWALRLGFKMECLAEKYDDVGNDHILLSRIRL